MQVIATIRVDAGETGTTNDIPVSDTALNAVLFDFNPTSNNDVTEIKALCAALISKMEKVRASGSPAQARNASVAITEIEGAQMRAVKALFAK